MGFYSDLIEKLLSVSVSESEQGRFTSFTKTCEMKGGCECRFLCENPGVAVAVRVARAASGSREALTQGGQEALSSLKGGALCRELCEKGVAKARFYGMAFHGGSFEVLTEEIGL